MPETAYHFNSGVTAQLKAVGTGWTADKLINLHLSHFLLVRPLSVWLPLIRRRANPQHHLLVMV